MKQKNLLALLTAVLLILPIGFSANTNMIVTLLRTSPSPVEPGQYANVWFQIENRGDMNAKNFVFTLTPKFPFSVYEGDSPEKYIGTLKMYEPVIVKYKIYVDENAVEGWNELDYKYSLTSFSNITVYGKSEIYVTYAPQLQIISVNPKDIEIMKKSYINMSIINLGHGEARNVRVTFDTSSTDVKMMGSNTKYIKSILPNEKVTVMFEIMSSDSNGVEIVPVHITYEDNNGTIETQNYNIGINVYGEPNIDVVAETSNNDASVEIINNGPVGAKFVETSILVDDQTHKFYIGDLNSDDFDIVDVPLSGYGTHKLNVNVTYKTPELKERKYSTTISVLTAEKKSSPYGTIIVIVLVLVAIAIFWKKVKK